MSIALVANTSGSGLNGFTTGAIDTTGATLLVRCAAYDGPATVTASDSKSNTWTGLTVRTSGGGAFHKLRIWYVANPTVGTGHTFTFGGTSSAMAGCVSAWSGAKVTSPFDQQNGAGVSSTSAAPGSITPSEDNELIIAGCSFEGSRTLSIDGGFTITNQVNFSGGSNYGVGMAYLIQTSLAAANPSWSWSGSADAAAAIASFKAEPVSGSVIPVFMNQYRQRWR